MRKLTLVLAFVVGLLISAFAGWWSEEPPGVSPSTAWALTQGYNDAMWYDLTAKHNEPLAGEAWELINSRWIMRPNAQGKMIQVRQVQREHCWGRNLRIIDCMLRWDDAVDLPV